MAFSHAVRAPRLPTVPHSPPFPFVFNCASAGAKVEEPGGCVNLSEQNYTSITKQKPKVRQRTIKTMLSVFFLALDETSLEEQFCFTIITGKKRDTKP